MPKTTTTTKKTTTRKKTTAPRTRKTTKKAAASAAKEKDLLGEEAVVEVDEIESEEADEVEAWSKASETDRLESVDADSAASKNGYGELVRLGRSRGWVTLADINDELPESALRTSENPSGGDRAARAARHSGFRSAAR